MRRVLLFLGLSLALVNAFGQVVFQEDWDGNGPGIEAWKTIDLDGNTPSTGAAFVTDAWTRVDRGHNEYYVDLGGPAGNFCIVSTSFYDLDDSQSNDWLISPEISIPADGEYFLIWDARTPGTANYRDGYEVKLSPSAGDTPEDFTIELLDVPEEEFEWTTRTVSLADYQGQTIRLAWVNTSIDKSFSLVDNIAIQSSTPETPECVNLIYPEDAAVDIDFSGRINFTWSPSETGGAPASYDFYISADPNGLTEPLTSLQDTSLSAVTGFQYNTTYYWKVVAKNGIGEAEDCSVYSFTTQENPFLPYCGITYEQLVMPISNVIFAGINNTSDAEAFSCHESFIDISGEVERGSSYDLILQANTFGDYEFRFIAFIDWNQDGVFEGENEVYPITETIQNSTGTDNELAMHTIQVPEDALLGTTRMRIKSESINEGGTGAYYDPCGGMYGQAEDYTIEVIRPDNINEFESSPVSVYPNPTSGMFKVSFNLAQTDNALLTIFNSNGEQVKSTQLNNVKTLTQDIDMSGYAKGIYTIQIRTGNNVITRKLIVQ